MTEKKMRERMRMVFTQDQLKRISLKDEDGRINMITDVHGMTCSEAMVFIRNLIALFRGSFKLTVIHGYNHGTAIRDMIRQETISKKVAGIHWTMRNDGITEFNIRSLCA